MGNSKPSDWDQELAIQAFESEGGSLVCGPHIQTPADHSSSDAEEKPVGDIDVSNPDQSQPVSWFRRLFNHPYICGLGTSAIFETLRWIKGLFL